MCSSDLIRLMTAHHSGAVVMADTAMREGGDPRIRIMGHAMRHQQLGEIELMKGTAGFSAVGTAARATFDVAQPVQF